MNDKVKSPKQRRLIKKGAEARDPQSMYRLAMLYARKLNLRNYDPAIRLRLDEINPIVGIIASAVAQDWRTGQGDAYKCFLEWAITGQKRPPSKASFIVALLKAAAGEEYLPAAYILGEIYESLGKTEIANGFYAQAASLSERCDERDDEVALCLAKMYFMGKGMRKCPDKALRYAEHAIALGNEEATELVPRWNEEVSQNRDLLSEELSVVDL